MDGLKGQAVRPLLKTLEEHNKEAYRSPFGVTLRNGIACPDCGAELIDTNPTVALAVYPPKYNTNCLSCDYSGYRY